MARVPTTFPANYTQAPRWRLNPTYPGCHPRLRFQSHEQPPGNALLADTQTFTYVIPDQEQWSAFLRGNLALNAETHIVAEYFYSSTRSRAGLRRRLKVA